MWNYLERVLGKSSKYYESLMRSRDTSKAITPDQLNQAISVLEPLIKKAFEFKMIMATTPELTPPKNNKNKSLTYYGTVLHPQYELHLYLDQEKKFQDTSQLQLIVTEIPAVNSELKKITSLPIWEEIIHYNTEIHHQLVKLSPDHPWSIYSKAKESLIGKTPKNQVAGYPQWLVNDIDFRKIAQKEFLFQMEIPDSEQVIYFFKDSIGLEVDFFVQKL